MTKYQSNSSRRSSLSYIKMGGGGLFGPCYFCTFCVCDVTDTSVCAYACFVAVDVHVDLYVCHMLCYIYSLIKDRKGHTSQEGILFFSAVTISISQLILRIEE